MRENIPAVFWRKSAEWSSRIALTWRDAEGEKSLSWAEYAARVAQMASALQNAGVKPGDTVALYSDTCVEWLISDLGILSIGAISVPLYANLMPDQVKYVIEHSEASFAIVRGKNRLEAVREIPSLRKIVVIGEDFGTFLGSGSSDPVPHREFTRSIRLDALATLVYTSGTTANPKGVMLTHGNIAAQLEFLLRRHPRTADDHMISYLPPAHITERVNLFRQAVTGYQLYLSRGVQDILADLKIVRPRRFIAVPRIWEKLQDLLLLDMGGFGPLKRFLYQRAVSRGHFLIEEARGNRKRWFALIEHALLKRLLGLDARQRLGLDQCLSFASGAAPLSMETVGFFYGLGMTVIQGYGMTECSGASHYGEEIPESLGTVGPVIDGFECKLTPEGEIILRSESIFQGYHKDPKATAEALRNGWLHTGDLAERDNRGNYRVTGRIKDIIITSAGKNIAPAPLEFAIKQHRAVSQAVVVGDGKKYLVALLTLQPGQTQRACETSIRQHIEKLNERWPSYQTIKNFSILDQDLTVESGELTPSLKVKRNVVQKKYAAIIDRLYERRNPADPSPERVAEARLL